MTVEKITREEVEDLARQAAVVLPEKVRHYAALIGVTYAHITIRNQQSLWASCSPNGNLSFNCILMKTPESIQDYVVVHELCHRLEMNHSKAFWAHVAKVIPDYKRCRKWLNTEGVSLIESMKGL